MTKSSAFLSGKLPADRLLLLLVSVAVLIGLYGRFKGIGTWPLGVDEFYISRSIDHILSSGLPAFPCGGYYTRGLLFQYVVAALRLSGLSPEFAGRFVAAISSIAVIPAAYLLGKRIHGSSTGWLAVIILSVSIWEIEMARFGRMYAPFQAIFAWYLLFYLRYTIDKQVVALRWMAGLSIVGVLTWEGGTLLGIANLFAVLQTHDRGRLKGADWRRLTGFSVLLVLLYLASRDLRELGAPEMAEAATAPHVSHSMQLIHALTASLQLHWLWFIVALLPLGLAAAATRFIWPYRQQWLTFAGLCAVLLSAAAHAFTATAGLLALMSLTGLIDWRELASNRARPFIQALLALFLFWAAYELASGGYFVDQLFGFPNIYERIGRPWGRAIPAVTVGIMICVAYWYARSTAVNAQTPTAIKSLLGLLFLLVLVVGAIPTERIETRYTFFLYPLMLIMSIAAILELIKHFCSPQTASNPIWMAIPLLLFAVSEDFQIRQVAHIDSAAVNFRLGMPSSRADHYYPRSDMRGIAQWLSSHVAPGDVVINGIPNLDQYYHGFDFFYLEEEDYRYDAYICWDGRTERWTNHPVLDKLDALKSIIDSGHRVYGSLYADVEARLRTAAQLHGWSIKSVYTAIDGKTHIVSIEAHETSLTN